MTKYECGHLSECVVLDSNPLSFAAYLQWKDSVGYDGDKSRCWSCYSKE